MDDLDIIGNLLLKESNLSDYAISTEEFCIINLIKIIEDDSDSDFYLYKIEYQLISFYEKIRYNSLYSSYVLVIEKILNSYFTNKNVLVLYDLLGKIQEECGVELIEDPRFVDFLNVKKGFTQLKCFVAIPHIQLNSFNQIQRKGNPLYESIKARFGTELGEDMFYIPAINFPQWFISANSEIKPLNEWRKEWQIRK